MELTGLPRLGENAYGFRVRDKQFSIVYGAPDVWVITPGRWRLRKVHGEYELTKPTGKFTPARMVDWVELLMTHLR